MYSTGNYNKYPLINHNGKEYKKKEYMYVCITESLCCTAEIGPTLKINTSVFKKHCVLQLPVYTSTFPNFEVCVHTCVCIVGSP